MRQMRQDLALKPPARLEFGRQLRLWDEYDPLDRIAGRRGGRHSYTANASAIATGRENHQGSPAGVIWRSRACLLAMLAVGCPSIVAGLECDVLGKPTVIQG